MEPAAAQEKQMAKVTRYGLVYTGDVIDDGSVLAPEAGVWCETYQQVGAPPVCYQWYASELSALLACRAQNLRTGRNSAGDFEYRVAALPDTFDFPAECQMDRPKGGAQATKIAELRSAEDAAWNKMMNGPPAAACTIPGQEGGNYLAWCAAADEMRTYSESLDGKAVQS